MCGSTSRVLCREGHASLEEGNWCLIQLLLQPLVTVVSTQLGGVATHLHPHLFVRHKGGLLDPCPHVPTPRQAGEKRDTCTVSTDRTCPRQARAGSGRIITSSCWSPGAFTEDQTETVVLALSTESVAQDLGDLRWRTAQPASVVLRVQWEESISPAGSPDHVWL